MADNISLEISKEIVTPIVEAKIKAAITAALGSKEEVIATLADKILFQKVTSSGTVSNYSSDNKYNWIDVVFTNQIKKVIEEELKSKVNESAEAIKAALVKHLKTAKGANAVATALLAGLSDTFTNSWRSKLDITISPMRD